MVLHYKNCCIWNKSICFFHDCLIQRYFSVENRVFMTNNRVNLALVTLPIFSLFPHFPLCIIICTIRVQNQTSADLLRFKIIQFEGGSLQLPKHHSCLASGAVIAMPSGQFGSWLRSIHEKRVSEGKKNAATAASSIHIVGNWSCARELFYSNDFR